MCASHELGIFWLDNDYMTNNFRLLLVLQWRKYELYNKITEIGYIWIWWIEISIFTLKKTWIHVCLHRHLTKGFKRASVLVVTILWFASFKNLPFCWILYRTAISEIPCNMKNQYNFFFPLSQLQPQEQQNKYAPELPKVIDFFFTLIKNSVPTWWENMCFVCLHICLCVCLFVSLFVVCFYGVFLAILRRAVD